MKVTLRYIIAIHLLTCLWIYLVDPGSLLISGARVDSDGIPHMVQVFRYSVTCVVIIGVCLLIFAPRIGACIGAAIYSYFLFSTLIVLRLMGVCPVPLMAVIAFYFSSNAMGLVACGMVFTRSSCGKRGQDGVGPRRSTNETEKASALAPAPFTR